MRKFDTSLETHKFELNDLEALVILRKFKMGILSETQATYELSKLYNFYE